MIEINNDEISVVIQGPVDWSLDERYLTATTVALCRKVREVLPGAEIILSTWEGQRLDGLDVDRVVFSKDPGTQGAWPSFVPSNVNRQITSTVAGLKASGRRYCLKCRSDVILEGTAFLHTYWALPPIAPDPRRLFERPIVSNNLTSRNTAEILARLPDHPLLFHPSDHVHFGLRSDLLALWDVELQSDEDAFHFLDRAQPNRWRYHELGRFTPEQFVLTGAISKRLPLDFPHFAYHSPVTTELSEYYMATHYAFVPDRAFPIHFAKYHTPHHFGFEWMRRNPDPDAPPQTPQAPPPVRRDWRWRLTFPVRNPAGFRRWLGRKIVAGAKHARARLTA